MVCVVLGNVPMVVANINILLHTVDRIIHLPGIFSGDKGAIDLPIPSGSFFKKRIPSCCSYS